MSCGGQDDKQLIRLRVINFLKIWLDKCFYDFAQDDALLKTVADFIESLPRFRMDMAAKTLRDTMRRKRCCKPGDGRGGRGQNER